MNYITYDDLAASSDEKILGQLADRNMSGNPDQKIIDKAIEDAKAIFESYAINQYDIQELRNNKPAFAIKANVDLALFFLFKNNKRFEIPTVIQQEYDRTMALLASWGDPIMLDADGNQLLGGTDEIIAGNKTESDLDEDIAGIAYVVQNNCKTNRSK